MTLYTSDYLEYYLTLLGWIINNGIWQIVEASSLYGLPFLIIVVQEWLRVRSEGADEGNKGVLSAARIENRVWVAIAVLMFACIPSVPVDLATIKFDDVRSAQCNVKVPQPADTRWSTAFTTLNNQTAYVPVWWFFLHSLSKGVTGAAIASIPCGNDLRQIRMDVDSTRIADPILAQEIADFTKDCYGPARAKMFMNRPTLSDAEMNDVTWVGSNYFNGTAGFYDAYHSNTPRTAWPYNATRDAGLAQVDSGGGYPSCKQWWGDSGKGLRDRVLAQVDPDLMTRIGKWAGFLTKAEVNDSVIRTVVAPRQQVMNQGAVYADYGGQVDLSLPNVLARDAGSLGLTMGAPAYFSAMDVLRRALPMVLSFLKMWIVIFIVPVIILAAYDLRVVMTMSTTMFALFFVEFIFELDRWIDSTVLDALYGWNSPHSNFDLLMGLNNATGDMLLNFVMGAMFLVVPSLWVAALGWAGFQVGNAMNGLRDASNEAQSAGGKAASIITKR